MQRILVVDDSGETRKVLRSILETDGFEVALASTVADAVRQLSRVDPHLLLVDLRLPDGDGFALARHLTAHPAWRGLPIVAISAYGDGTAEMEARSVGCARFLRKPVEPRELLSAVRGAIAGMRTQHRYEGDARA